MGTDNLLLFISQAVRIFETSRYTHAFTDMLFHAFTNLLFPDEFLCEIFIPGSVSGIIQSIFDPSNLTLARYQRVTSVILFITHMKGYS